MQNQTENEEELKALVQEKMDKVTAEHQKRLSDTGVVPFSLKKLGVDDAEKNSVYHIVCFREYVGDYIKVLKKNGYPAQVFDCNPEQYMKD